MCFVHHWVYYWLYRRCFIANIRIRAYFLPPCDIGHLPSFLANLHLYPSHALTSFYLLVFSYTSFDLIWHKTTTVKALICNIPFCARIFLQPLSLIFSCLILILDYQPIFLSHCCQFISVYSQ